MFVVFLLLVLSCSLIQAEPKRAVGVSCFSGVDCATDEACVTQSFAIGKRQFVAGGGHCRTLGGVGDRCFVSGASGKPSTMVYHTPCADGLTCIGSGMYVVPDGEVGKCG